MPSRNAPPDSSPVVGSTVVEKWYKSNEFEALKTLYETQVTHLRYLTDIDNKVFGGYITIQLGLAAWLTNRPSLPNVGTSTLAPWPKVGLVAVDVVLVAVTLILLYKNLRRRKEVKEIVVNVNECLGYTEHGAYMVGKPVQAKPEFRPWFKIYLWAVVVAWIGVVITICST